MTARSDSADSAAHNLDSGPDPARDSALDSAIDSGRDSGLIDPGRTPNAGTVGATVSLRFGSGTIAAIDDLDADGRDEVIATVGRLHVIEIDAYAATASDHELADIEPFRDDAWALGNGEVAVATLDGIEYWALARADGGWAATSLGTQDGMVSCAAGVGDLDGDGVADVAMRESAGLVLRSGPIAGGTEGRVIATIEDTDAYCRFPRGDLDGDGNDDLVWSEHQDDQVYVRLGPITADATTYAAADFATHVIDLRQGCSIAATGLLDDLDADGTRELVVACQYDLLVYDGFTATTAPTDPDWALETEYLYFLPREPALAVAAWDRDRAAWWYGPGPRPRGNADVPVGAMAGRFGRLGGDDPTDATWTDGDYIHAAPAWGNLSGDDIDRDGFAGSEDCDDEDGDVRPGAFDSADGLDNDCDGATDETLAVVPTPVCELVGNRNAKAGQEAFARWVDPAGDWLAWSDEGGEGPGLGNPATGVTSVLSGVYERADLGAAGDIDGDGNQDMWVGGDPSGLLFVWLASGPVASPTLREFRVELEAGDGGGIGDVDGDGIDDLYVWGAEYVDGSYETRAVIALGPDLDQVYPPSLPGGDTHGPADLDGDGQADLLVEPYSGADSEFWFGPLAELREADDLPAADGTLPSAEILAAADVDGDGSSDIIATSGSAAVVAYGPWSPGTHDLAAEATGSVEGPEGEALVAAWIDGWLVVGSSGVDGERGRVLGYSGAPLGARGEDEAEIVVSGDVEGDRVGAALLGADIDGDGVLELVVNAPGIDVLDDEGTVRAYLLP